MFQTSTQKKHWMFSTLEEIQEIRRQANLAYRQRYANILVHGDENVFLTPEEEEMLCKIVAETGLRFFLLFFLN